MFEKEAEEYTLKRLVGLEDFDSYQSAYDRFENGVQDAFKEGAEFGYNKANEWHYVKDGIFPTHSKGVLVFTDEGVGLGIYGLDNKKWYTYDTGFEVIAWKEIVLPELKESE
jgi:hypothetical protein